MNQAEAYHELTAYTLSLGDEDFIHQHVADAYSAQTATMDTKAIQLFFALAGLYLLIEKSFTGRQVQQAHQSMALRSKEFIRIDLPEYRGAIFVEDVLKVNDAEERNRMIKEWCVCVWNAYSNQRAMVVDATAKLLDMG